ncbi:caspase family protein [Brasilonema sp. UFV-L1]|uniref:caspase family protein n=1 Tax=Brasilonema sp. UFV-L1 TaxID=2234130 RepID=UPI00145DC129|nr:caspase family protein [Brasilonema sp. UFV-L1]NMG11267.1 caspase family protein [Brasilonema sp. UFV-L1]
MDNPSNQISKLYALLIGIDCYLPNQLPDGGSYNNLGGCVRDIRYVEDFLKLKLKMPPEQIFKLTASDIGKPEPAEPPEKRPTYENMVAMFNHLTSVAEPGDQVYIHYSGHGGRAKTNYPQLKGENGIDEALVPTDIGNSTARYLRDIEIAKLLERMVAKKLVVTVVLDSCHSGGATKGDDAEIRGLDTIDETPRSTESMVASDEELAKTWKALTKSETRDFQLGSGWLPQPEGYVLLAACRSNESAFEYAFNGKERNGALTYWLLDSLDPLTPGLTYKVLHDRLLAKIHSQFQRQTPQLQGEGSRLVFGSDRISLQYAVNVNQIDANKRLLLNGGQVQGLNKGAQFAIYPPGTTDFTEVNKRLALAEITSVGATESWAEIKETFRSESIEQAAQALLINPKSVKLVRKIRLVEKAEGTQEDELPTEVDQKQSAALQAVADAMPIGNGWVELVFGNETADYQVTVNRNSEYEICDPSTTPIANLRPALKIGELDAAASIVKRLVHLAKYRATQQLNNYYHRSNLPGTKLAFTLEMIGKQSNYDPVEPPEPQPFDEPGNTPMLKVNEWVFIRLRNDSSQPLNVAILNLKPDLGISQVYPSGSGNFITFDPGQEEILPLHASLPNGYEDAQDILKAFATVGATDFHWLELPPLDQPILFPTGKNPENPLEELLAAVAASQPPTKNLEPARYPASEWIAEQVVVRITNEK